MQDPISKRFLIKIMCAGVVTEDDALKYLDWLSKHFSDKQIDLNDLIDKINEEIISRKQQIRIAVNEFSGINEIVFVSIVDDDAIQKHNYFSALDMEYFKALLEEILFSRRKSVSRFSALNVASKVKIGSLTTASAQELLNEWVFARYLRLGPNREYALDTRCIHDFDNYFNKNFASTIDICMICLRKIFQVSQKCPHCNESMHTNCLDLYSRNNNIYPCCEEELVVYMKLPQGESNNSKQSGSSQLLK